MLFPENDPSKSYQDRSEEPALRASGDARSAYTVPLRQLDETRALLAASRTELLEEIERQARELRLLHEIRKMLLGVYDLAEIYRTAVESISSVFGFNFISVYRLLQSELVLQAQVGYEQFYDRIPVGRGVNGQVAMSGRGVLLHDVRHYSNYLEANPAVTSALCVPLLGPGYEVLGTLSIESDDNRQLNERDYKLAQALAEHISMALSQALFYEREKRRISQLTVLNHISRELSTALDIDQVVQCVTGTMREELGYYSVNIGLIEGNELVFRRISLPEGPSREYRWPLATNSLSCRCAREGEMIICGDVKNDPRYLFIPEIPRTQSEAVLPLRIEGAVIGVLDVESDHPTNFDDEEIVLFRTLADQTSIALANARRFADLQRQSLELNKTNRALAEANRLKSEFLANVSHELRTPLNSIIGYVDMLQNGFYGEVSEAMNDPLERVFRNGRRLLALINDILDLANIEAGRMHLLVEEALSSELLSSLALANRSTAEEKGLLFETEMTADAPRIIQTDIKRVQQVAGILISNAIKFTHQGFVRVTISGCNGVSQAFCIAVSDSGIGIPVSEYENIFEEFRQVDGSSTRQYGGTGLGLALARRLVRQMGGRLEVTSEVGKGSTFTATLPILPLEQTSIL